MEQTNEQIAIRVSVNTIIGNVALSVIKFIAGIAGNSTAMLSDAVHSMSDVLSTVVVIIGTKLANKKSDAEHPYGHERFECVAALILAVMLGVTGVAIGYSAIDNIASGRYASAEMPGLLPLIAAIVSIVTKEAMYWYTRAAGKKIHSGALMADAWHHRSDALSSIGSLVGIAGARMGVLVLDSIAGIVICAFILKVAYDVFADSIVKMTDHASDPDTVKAIRATVESVEGVKRIRDLKTRQFGEKIYVDTDISADATMDLASAHEIARKVHVAVEKNHPMVKHCMVHVGPYYENEATAAVPAGEAVAESPEAAANEASEEANL